MHAHTRADQQASHVGRTAARLYKVGLHMGVAAAFHLGSQAEAGNQSSVR